MKESCIYNSCKKIVKDIKLLAWRAVFFTMVGSYSFSCSNNLRGSNMPDILKYDDNATPRVTLPYILDISNRKKKLIYYGVRHSSDPNDSMYLDIEKRFVRLKPEIALNEGGNGFPSFSTKDSAIRFTADPGFLIFLCQKYSAPVTTLEPPDSLEYNYLLDKYKKSDVLLMYFVRQIEQLQRRGNFTDAEFNKKMQAFLLSLKKRGMPLNEQETELMHLISYYEIFFKTKFYWRQFDPTTYWPIYNKTVLNEISRESSYFRDRYVLKIIEQNFKKHDRIFVVMGGSHLVIQEPVLRYMFRKS